MTTAELAERLLISDRAVAKWEKQGEDADIRPVNQAGLDSLLRAADMDVQVRFVALLSDDEDARMAQAVDPAATHGLVGDYIKHSGDGRLMVRVPKGIYLSGSSNEAEWVDEFYIDVFPVTNADYARFVAATDHPSPGHWANGRCERNRYDNPVVHVSWIDAVAYAEWAGKRLPSAAEWEKAARGTKGATFPWGDQATVAKCNVRESRIGETTDVSRFHSGVSPYGVYDMVGNVWEWLGEQTGMGRYGLKGSAFTSTFARGYPAETNDANVFMQDDDTGFRCASSPDQMRPEER
ncbi:DNA-binding protein [Arthrobacter terricola]|uniref:DNA-binding protein n=2 Tax=Arthrobacter TaxID=1663 RepID=A0A4R5KCB9_9MICC|nr:DNA-binding protein [Arthrobacter terricola]